MDLICFKFFSSFFKKLSFSLLDINMKNESIKKNILNNSDFGKTLIFRNYSNIDTPYSYLDNTFQKSKRYHPSDTFYKELMSKKNETYEQYFKNNIIECDNTKEKENKELKKFKKLRLRILKRLMKFIVNLYLC